MGRVFATADLHGNWEVWKAIKKELKPEDTLYILGDCADRGDRGWDIIKEAYKDSRIIYLKGNHEEMLADAIYDVNRHGSAGRNWQLLNFNGGSSTFNDWVNDGEDLSWEKKLKKLPNHAIYINKLGQTILLSHAGYTPFFKGDLPNEDQLLWDRDHFLDEWPVDDELADTMIIAGHTPGPYLAEDLHMVWEENKPLWYCNGHKCCIDNFTIKTNKAILLDLDTFEYKVV